MTLIVPLEPEEEAQLTAVARAKGVSTDALVREALERILAEAAAIPAATTGAALVAAMQASPYREISLEVPRNRLPVRDAAF